MVLIEKKEFTTRDISRATGLSFNGVANQYKKGRLKSSLPPLEGRLKIRFTLEDINNWIESRKEMEKYTGNYKPVKFDITKLYQ